MLDTFENDCTVVVQGASRGIGLGLVRALLAGDRVGRVIATCRDPDRAGSLTGIDDARLEVIALDVVRPHTIERAAAGLAERSVRVHLLINAAGVLHGPDFGPEKRLEDIDADVMARVLAVNTIGPALVIKAFRPLLAREGKVVVAAISARVGSIGDNRLGGWYAYRASKAALNQVVRTAGIELARRNRNAIVAALHPGTTDTGLSEPFQDNVPERQLFSVEQTSNYMLEVIDGLTTDDSGGFFAWDGRAIDW